MVDLLAGLHAFPDLHRNLTAFGRKSFSKDEGFGGFDWAEDVEKDGSLSVFGMIQIHIFVSSREAELPWNRIMLLAQVCADASTSEIWSQPMVDQPVIDVSEGFLRRRAD